MYCYHCGAQNMDQARFCQKCGQALVPVPDRPSVWNRWRGRYPCWLIPAIAVLSVLCVADVIIVALLLLLPAPQKATIAAAVGPTSSYSTPTATPTPLPTSTLTLTPTVVPPTRLSGRVVDQDTARPVEGARVVIGDREAITDQDGRFEVVGLSDGQYAILTTKDGYDPILSAIVSVGEGEAKNVDVALFPQGTVSYPKDPMSTNQVDPNGAPTAEGAERLAREQGLSGKVVAAREVTLQGEYLVNYKVGEELRSAKIALNHAAWELTDEKGQVWNIVRTCGNLAMAVPAGMTIPAQCVARASTAQPTPTPTPTPTPAGVSQGEIVWSEPMKISNNVGYLVVPSIIADDEGHVYAVWEEHNPTVCEKTEDLYFAVHYNIWDGTSWLGQQDIPHSTNRGEPRVAIDREGNLHVSWIELNFSTQEAAFYYSKWDKRTWTNPLTIPLPYNFPIIPNIIIAIDGTNRVHFVSGLDHIWLDDTAWSTLVEIPSDGKILSPMDLVADQDGNLHLIAAQTGGQINEWAVHYSRWDSTSWSRPAAIAVSGGCSGMSSMALDRDGRIHVAMQTGTYKPLDKTGACWIAYTQGSKGAWTEPIAISETLKEHGRSPRIAVDRRGRIHVVWCDEDGIYYTGLVGEAWSAPVILSKNVQGPNYDPDVTIDSQDNIHVLWAATVNGGAVDVYHTVGSMR